MRVPFNRLLIDIYRNGRDDLIDKYKYNTVCFEFGEDDELKPLDELFEKLRELSNGYISDNNDTYRVEKEETDKNKEPENVNDIENSVVLVEEIEPEKVENKESIESVIEGFYSQVGGLSSDFEQLGLDLDDCPKEIEEPLSKSNQESDFPFLDMNPFTGEMDDFSPF